MPYQNPKQAYGVGRGINYWFGEIVSVDSPYQGGEVQVRIHGIQDDKGAIPDENLRWARMMHPVTSAQMHGSGSSHRLIVGTTVMGIFMDEDEQMPLILGTMGASGDVANTSSASAPVASKTPGSFRT